MTRGRSLLFPIFFPIFVTATVGALASCEERSEPLQIFRKPEAGALSGGMDAGSPGGPPPSIKLDARPAPSACTTPKPEICNDIDDDCNGKVDDVPPDTVLTNVLTCGSCNVSCLPVPPNADSVCAAGKCGFTCKAGFFDANNSKTDGCECLSMDKEICDGLDNTCDGKVDETFDLMKDPNNCGKCGNKCMLPGAVAACVNGQCAIDKCNMGAFDKDKNPMNGCEATCGETNMGIEICDGLDNDCDGKVDEIESEANRTMDSKLVHVASANVTMFAHEASRPDATETNAGSNGLGAACSAPGKLPWSNVTKTEAQMACKALGDKWRLCTKEEWLAACSKGGMNAYPYGPAYMPMACNGGDFNPTSPRVLPTGRANLCSANPTGQAADAIFDLSGNVREWVSAMAKPDEGVELRGGAYNVLGVEASPGVKDSPGLKCAGSVPAPGADVRLPSVGFRCCYPGKLP